MASKKPIPTITTSSWRVGHEAARKVIKEIKKKEKREAKAKGKPKEALSVASTVASAPSIKSDDSIGVEDKKVLDNEDNTNDNLTAPASDKNVISDEELDLTEQDIDEVVSEESNKILSEGDAKQLKKSRVLSKEAKGVLKELQAPLSGKKFNYQPEIFQRLMILNLIVKGADRFFKDK